MLSSRKTACFLVGLLLLACLGSTAEGTPREYWLEAIGPYGIYCDWPATGRMTSDHDSGWGRLYLAETTGVMHRRKWLIVPHLARYGVWEKIIFGTTEDGYFIFDSAQEYGDDQRRIFETEDEWRSALDDLGVPKEVELLDPDEVAKTRSDQALRPWAYFFFSGRMGLSDDDWVGNLVLCLLSLCFAGALAWRPALWPCVVLSCAVTVFLAPMSHGLSDQGGTICGIWLFYIGAGYLGRGVRSLIVHWREQRARPVGGSAA